ncbi:hypothetical protein Goshw_025790 [Gossypium schwendimanii]|uniref:Uncharacterized protein n=1 Tax=Gossypium schwendimanii TaxID=34291 RepID=A0A7J9KZ89_GOSSC|nr:hypothetical protein [Gossypium schwendimanii]
MSFAGAPDNVRYEMNNQNRLFLSRHCGNHIVTLYNCGLQRMEIIYFIRQLLFSPLQMLNPKPTTIKLESWVLNANGCGCRDELLYWDGTRLHRAPYENGSA